MSAEPTGRPTRTLWHYTLLVYKNSTARQSDVRGNAVYTHTHTLHTAQTFSRVQMLPPMSPRMQKGWGRQTAGVGVLLRWTDPVGKPQAGRHTTATTYLLNVGFERLSALYVETSFWKNKHGRCRWEAEDITRKMFKNWPETNTEV